MGGRGRSAPSYLRTTPGRFTLRLEAEDVAYITSHTLALSRQAIAEAIQQMPLNPTQKVELGEDLKYARQVSLTWGGYTKTAVLTENPDHTLTLPAHFQGKVPHPSEISFAFVPDYQVVSSKDPTFGAIYPFLPTHRQWHIISRPADEAGNRFTRHQDRFGLTQPTLRWVSGQNIRELYVDGMTNEQFLTQTGLRLSLAKGGVVLSKRLSRVMRPYFVAHHFDPAEVTIQYLNLSESGKKKWDGAGVISRAMLRKMVLSQELSPAKRAVLEHEIETAGRVEYTVLTANGQDKGHAIVSDTLEVDFLLPEDTKKEVQLNSGKTFVGLNFVHHKTHMAMDEQSTINLHGAVDEEFLLDRLYERGELFKEGLQNGRIAALMGQIDENATLDELETWPLREFLASGGDPRWFQSAIKTVVNQHLKPLQAWLDNPADHRLRLPTPGGRFYVMPVTVGRAAGLEGLKVNRGEAKLDGRFATVWVNEADWITLADSPTRAGIASILGGADNDDALWVLPHTNSSGHHQLLLWRSPNEPGEYVILKPTADSDTLSWHRTLEDSVRFMPLNTQQLEPRKDSLPGSGQNVIDMASGGGLGEGEPYSPEIMELAVNRTVQNAGVLGQYINQGMVNKAIGRHTPLPAPTEVVIDAVNKTGEDLSPVCQWSELEGAAIRLSGTPVPRAIQHRVSRPPQGQQGELPPLKTTTDHWLDIRDAGVRLHVQAMQQTREKLAAEAMPPQELFDYVITHHPETIATGQAYLTLYARTVRRLKEERPFGVLTPQDQETLRKTAETFLANYPDEQHSAILRGAIVSNYMKDKPGSDSALWLEGEKTAEGHHPGIGHKTIQALREIGLLGEIIATKAGLVMYQDPEPRPKLPQTVQIHGVWENSGNPPKQLYQDATQKFQGMALTIREENGEKVTYTSQGNRFGTIGKAQAGQFQDGETLHIRQAVAHKGNLRVIWQGDTP